MSNAVLPRDADIGLAARTTRRSPARLGLAGLGVLAALGAVWYAADWWTRGRFIESTDDAYVGGNLTAISPHIAGFVAAVEVADNQSVRADQVLLRLDSRDMRAAAAHAQAVLEQRVAAVASLQARVALQRSAIAEAGAKLDARLALAAFARQDAARYQSLALASAASRQEAQRSSAAEGEARAGVASAKAGSTAAAQQLDVLAADLVEARAAVAQAQADLETARLNLGYTEIRTPIAGYVGNRSAQVGAYVTAGSYLLTIVPERNLWVEANFKEDQLRRIRPGMAAEIVADVAPGQVMRGHVQSVAPGTGAVFSVIPPENATGNFTKIVQRVPVRVALDAQGATLGQIRPGLSAVVSVDTRSGAADAR